MKGLPFLVVLEMGGLFLYSTSLCCHVSAAASMRFANAFRLSNGIRKCQSFDIV